MRIAYGTYATPDLPLEQAAPLLAEIGYDGVEVCVSPRHAASMPEEMDPARRLRNCESCSGGWPSAFRPSSPWATCWPRTRTSTGERRST